jgi:hypothetical protein
MDFPDSRLPAECLALIQELFTKDIVDTYDAEFGAGGYGFITNGRLYRLSFSTEDEPLAFTLSSGSDCPYWEASKPTIDRLIAGMNKAHPSANYCWRGVYGYQMGVSTKGSVLDLPDRKKAAQAELLRCKQVLDLALDGQEEVIARLNKERWRDADSDSTADDQA